MSPSTPRPLQILTLVSAVMALIALGMVFLYAPREVSMGEVQRIFYFHVPSAWVGGLAFLVTLVAGIVFLRTGNHKWDRIALSSVEIGIVFSAMTLLTGMLWGRPAWNTWWTWDPRTTTYLIMLLVYFAYLFLRQGIDDPDRRARIASVYGIVGFISIPLTFFSIRLWRTIHPVVIGSSDPGSQGSFNMVAPMVHTLLFSLAFFTVLYVTLLWHRLRLADEAQRIEELRAQMVSA
jgi:heme exporter protein C